MHWEDRNMSLEYFTIGADFVPTNSNTDLFIRGDVNALVGDELKDVLDRASYRIFNLELPLTNNKKPIIKNGPSLIAQRDTIKAYKELRVDLLTLANNHIMDQGVQGLNSTIETLADENINYLGAGDNISESAKPFVFEFAGKTIGVYACAEHEFSVADENTPGANPYDPLWSFDHVLELKKNTDYVIVLYHGGKELYRYPSPMLQKTCRRFVDKGADLVICQHSHCIGCEEKYHEKTIVYGQGNFLFDHSDNECWKTSLLIKVDSNFEVSYIPLMKVGMGVRLAEELKSKEIMEGFCTRSKEIENTKIVEKKYEELAERIQEFYLYSISGKKALPFRVINKITRGALVKLYLMRVYKLESIVKIYNFIECEAHRELLAYGLKRKFR